MLFLHYFSLIKNKFEYFKFLLPVFVISFMCGGGLYTLYTKLTDPTVSVVMGTYNRAELLPRAVDSILSQTYKDFEFIIIVDGSTDETADILKNYALKDNRIRILNNDKNKGLVYSLNRGLDAARGKYIARMDDDDISLPDRLAYQVDFMENNPDITVCGSFKKTLFTGQSITPESLPPYEPTEYDISDNAIISYFHVPIFHPTAMIRKKFLDVFQIRYDERYPDAEDTPFWHEIIQKGGKIITLPAELVFRGASSKKKYYKSTQINSYHYFLKNSLQNFINTDSFNGWLSETQKCAILDAMKNHIGERPYLTEDAIQHVMKIYNCSKQK